MCYKKNQNKEGSTMTKNPPGPKAHAQHYGACYATRGERDGLAQSFVREGLLRGEQILCLVSDVDEAAHIFLNPHGLGGICQPRKHQVVFRRAESFYLSDGAFDPHRVLSLFMSCVRSALEIGFAGVRVVSDASWLLEHPLGAHEVVDYEHRVNKVAKGMPCSALCLYPREVLPKPFLAYVFLTHPYIFRKGRCFFNPHYEDFDVLLEAPSPTDIYHGLFKALVPIGP
jgi:hypothetical protein